MEYRTNSERHIKNAKSAREAGYLRDDHTISARGTSFNGKGTLSRKAVAGSFRSAARKQLSGHQG